MKSLTHYFQVSKSPSDEPTTGSNDDALENCNVKKNNEDQIKDVEKCLPKPKKLSLKSKKSQLESKSEKISKIKSPTVLSPDSTVNTSGKKKRKKLSKPDEELPAKDAKPAVNSGGPQTSFTNAMQNILQRVLKKTCPEPNADVSSDDGGIKITDEIIDAMISESGGLDNMDMDIDITTPKSGGKKRGRKPKSPKKESNGLPSVEKLSYEELEEELIKERLLLAKLKETFLASNPDEEALAKYNSTLNRKNKIALNSPTKADETPSTPNSGKTKSGDAEGKNICSTPKSSKKSRLSTCKSPSKSVSKSTKVLKKSNSVKNTPEVLKTSNSAKNTPEVLKKSNSVKNTPEVLKKSNSVKNTPEVLKKTNFAKNTPEVLKKSNSVKNTPEVLKKSNAGKNTPENNTQLMKEVLEYLDHTDSKNGTPSPRKNSPRSKSSHGKDKMEAKSKKQLEFPKTDVQNEEKKEMEENGAAELKKKNGTKGEKKTVPIVPAEKKRKRSKKNDSVDDAEELPVKKKTTKKSASEEKEQILEPSSPQKKIKKVKSNKEVGKEKLAKKKNSVGKGSTKKKSEKIANGIDLNSSLDSVFVEHSSEKTKDDDGLSQKTPKSNSEKESAEKKTCKADPSNSADSLQKNSLFKYFGKVDKSFMKKEEKSSSLTTQAIVHSPPVSPSKKRKSSGPPFSPRRKKLKSMLADADKIELLSSEIIANTEFDNSNNTDSKKESENVNTHQLKPKSSPKKWSMRVKLAVQSPSKTSNSGELLSSSKASKSPCDKSSPESKVKRKLFDINSKTSVKIPDDTNSSDSSDVQFVDEKVPAIKASQMELPKETVTPSTSTSKESDTPKPAVKLASIFLKKSTPKISSSASDSPTVVKTDEKSLKAKKDFLSSGVPDTIKHKSEQLKFLEKFQEEQYFVPFPKINHVGYDHLCSNPDSLLELEKLFKFRPVRDTNEMVNESLKKSWENVIELRKSQIPALTDEHYWTKCNDFKRQQRYLKKQAGNFSFEVFEKKFKKVLAVDQNSSTKNQEMWTEKYKPQSCREVLGNGARVSELKQWLEEQKVSKKKYENSDESSGDEFISSDDDSSLGKRLNNIAVLAGPSGCGKTSSVYAAAKELGCKVLELNASCNRNGKKILTELLEATQSHRVKQASSALVDIFSKANKNKRNDKKKKIKVPKTKKSEGQDPDSKVMSIILIEDADLIFLEHDDGFVAALSLLSTMSKRPIILVANSIRCPHLSKFIKQQCLLLEFSKPSFSDIKTWLQLIALYEAVELPSEIAEKIVYETDKDVRRAMLYLQYHVLSTIKPQVNSDVDWPLDVGKLWWQWPSPFSVSPLTIQTLKKSTPLLLETCDSHESISDESQKPFVPSPEACSKFHKLASFVDNIALAEICSSSDYHTLKSNDPSPKSWQVNAIDSCLLNEPNNLEHVGHDSISAALSHELISRHARYLDLKLNDAIQIGLSPDLARWKKKIKKVEEIILTGLPMFEQLHRESAFCDYLPIVRSIGRAECLRLVGNSKRSNRFFNYLSGLNIRADESQRTLMCNAFVFVNETAANS